MMNEHQNKFVKIIEGFRNGYGVRTVFEDFVRLGTYEIGQNVRRSLGCEIDDDDEKAYLEIVKRYKPEEVRGPFKNLFDCLVEGLEKTEGDFLGPIFMQLQLGNKALGQFFTPHHVSLMMAEMSIDPDEVRQEIERKGYVSMNDPCCGSGGMPLAYAQAFRAAGFQPETELLIVAQDLGDIPARMTYLQLSLRGLAAVVLNMNSFIPDTVFWKRYTPVFFWQNWPSRLGKRSDHSSTIPASNAIDCESKEIVAESKPKRNRLTHPPRTVQRSLLDGMP